MFLLSNLLKVYLAVDLLNNKDLDLGFIDRWFNITSEAVSISLSSTYFWISSIKSFPNLSPYHAYSVHRRKSSLLVGMFGILRVRSWKITYGGGSFPWLPACAPAWAFRTASHHMPWNSPARVLMKLPRLQEYGEIMITGKLHRMRLHEEFLTLCG